MKKSLLVFTVLILGATNLEAYTYNMQNSTSRTLRVCAAVAGSPKSECNTVARGKSVPLRFTDAGRTGLALARVTASDPSGANSVTFPGSSATNGALGDKAFIVTSHEGAHNPDGTPNPDALRIDNK